MDELLPSVFYGYPSTHGGTSRIEFNPAGTSLGISIIVNEGNYNITSTFELNKDQAVLIAKKILEWA